MSYTIEAVEKQIREPLIKGEVFHSYLLTLDGQKVEMLQKPTSEPPKVGEAIEGTIEPGREKHDGTKWPDKFKRLRSIQGGFRPRDPKETNSIVRQHSQEMAIRWMTLRNEGTEDWHRLKEVIDWFQADVQGEPPVEPPKAVRDPAPTIPQDRVEKLRQAAKTIPPATVLAKLTALGVQTAKVADLNVDQAEAFESWLEHERS